jgi:hypothetical protein
MAIPMSYFTAKTVDDWLERLKKPSGAFMKSRRRIAFDHELSLLSGILRYFREYLDESFRHPLFERHKEDANTGRSRRRVNKDIKPEDFQRFLTHLREQLHGEILGSMATVQHFQALRI